MIEIAETDDRSTCYALRHTVFVEEQGYTAEGEVDDLDPFSHHILARENGTPIATARVHLEGDTAKIGRVCVIAVRRGIGLAQTLSMLPLLWPPKKERSAQSSVRRSTRLGSTKS